MSIASNRAAILDGQVSCEEVTRRALAVAERWQPVTNAFIRIEPEAALAAAARADRALARGEAPGPLVGAPVAYKDMFDRSGRTCSFGSRIGQARAPAESAIAVQRLEAAGAIPLGALNMSEFALGPTGHNATFGPARNPWDSGRVTGGSSSGAGAAVAVGAVAGALGSDTGGSIRIPASCCGVVGLKPTQGGIDARGAMPLSPSLDCVGPIAAGAEDCQALFEALAFGDDRFAPAAEARSLRFAFPLAALSRDVSGDILSALAAAAEVFRGCGHTVAEAPLPDISRLHRLADVVQRPQSLSAHYANLSALRDDYSAPVRRRIEGGLFIGAAAYVQALRQRRSHRQALLDSVFADADVLMLPSVGTPTPRIDETDEAQVGAIPELVARMTRWTRWLNYLGLPALSLPCGCDAAGLPVGLQLVAPPFRERDLFAAARRFEAAAPALAWSGGPAPPTDP